MVADAVAPSAPQKHTTTPLAVTVAMATPAKRPRTANETFAAGEEVLAQWPAAGRDSPWHDAKVAAANEDGTYALSYEALARVNPAVPEASIRSRSDAPAGPTFRAQCASLALEIANNKPELRAPLAEMCQALQRSTDIHAELRAILVAIGAEDASVDPSQARMPPPPPTEGAPRPSARAPGGNLDEGSTPPPTRQPPQEIFLGDARSLSVPGPNLQAAQRLRLRLAGVVEEGAAAEEGTAPGEGGAGGTGASGGSGAGAGGSGDGALTTPSTVLASTFFMPEFEGADPAFKDFVMSRLKYNYGERDLQDRMIVNWVRDDPHVFLSLARVLRLCSLLSMMLTDTGGSDAMATVTGSAACKIG